MKKGNYVKIQLFEGDNLVDEVTADGLIGVLIAEQVNATRSSFVISGYVSPVDMIVAKQNIMRGVDEVIEKNTDLTPEDVKKAEEYANKSYKREDLE